MKRDISKIFSLRVASLAGAALLCAVIIAPRPAFAWSEKTHQMIADKEIQLMPGEIQAAVKKNKAAYMTGLKEEGELYDRVLSENDSASASFIQQRGMERYFMLLKGLNLALEKKSDQRTIAYEAGQITRAGADLLEPLPADGGFRTMELTGYRLFFLEDMQNTQDSFKFVPGGRRQITSYPQRISEELDLASRKGVIIYTAYKKGGSFYLVEDDAHVMANRAINFIADSLYTQILTRDAAKRDPYDPALYLQLDRFRNIGKKYDDNDPSVDSPKAPTAPTIAAVKAPTVQAPAPKPKQTKAKLDKSNTEKAETITPAKKGTEKKNADTTQKQK